MDTHIWRPSYESDFEVEIYDNSVVGEEDEHEDEWSLDVYREHDGTQEDDFAEKITMTTDLITQGLEDHQQQDVGDLSVRPKKRRRTIIDLEFDEAEHAVEEREMPADEIFFNIAKSEKQAQRLQKITTRGRELEDRIESNHEIYATISSALEEKHENRKALKRRLSFSQSKYYELGQERNNELLAIRNEHMNQLLAIRDKYKHADEMRVNIDVMEEDLSTEMDETKSLSIKLIDVSDEISSLKNKQNENIQKKRTLTRAIERSQNATFLLSQRQIFALMQKAGSFPRTLSNADEILDLDAESKDQEEDQDDDKEITCVICVYDYDPKTRVKMGHGSTSTSDGKIECVGHMCKPCLLRLATMLPRNCPFCRASLLKYPWSPFNTCKR